MVAAVKTPNRPDQSLSSNQQGIVFLCAGLFVFSFQDVIIKLLSDDYPVHELVFVRGLIAMPLLLALVHLDGGFSKLKSSAPGLMIVRVLCMFSSYMTFYLSIAAIPITTAVSLFFTSPLMITALAVPFLGEKVGVRRWLGVAAGFVGVLIMFRPGFGVLEPAVLLPLASAFTYSIGQILTRRIGTKDSAAAMGFYSAMIFTYLGGLIGFGIHISGLESGNHPSLKFLFMPWSMPGGLELAMLLTTGLISAAGFYLLTQAYRIGSANVVSPFEYSGLIWAVVLTYLVWGDVPDMFTIAGAGLIIASGIYVLKREGIVSKKPLAAKGPYRTR